MDIYLCDYLHLKENDDCTLALHAALSDAKKCSNPVLHLGGGKLNFYGKYATKRHYYMSNNHPGMKNIIFPLIGFNSLTVDGDGADLLFHGEILPFVIDSSKNITLKNFSVDYPHPFFFQGKIVASDKNFAELEFNTDILNVDVTDNGNLLFSAPGDGWKIEKDQLLVCEFEHNTKAPSAYISPYILSLAKEKTTSFLGNMFRYLTAEKTAENRIRFTGDFRLTHTVGNMFVCTFSGRENPGIFVNLSKNTVIENVSLYATGAMGIICQLSENITLNGVKTVVRENSGRYLSVNADSTHFVNCTGAVKYKDCVFTNMLDDAGNVHGNYHKIEKKVNEHTYLLSFGHPDQEGINIYFEGDTVNVINNKTLQPLPCELTVSHSELISDKYMSVEFNEPVPDFEYGFCTENITRMPELYIDGCITGNNRPRGFLCSTYKKAVIENCTFFNMMCGLCFPGDCNDWFESGHVSDVTVKNNNFANSAYTGGAAIHIRPNVKEGAAPYHKNIKITNNTFTQNGKRFLAANCAEGIVFKDNKYIYDSTLPLHAPVGENGIDLSNCSNCKIDLAEQAK